MAEGSIGAAVEKLGANTIKAREEGLEDLRRVLNQSRANKRLDALGDEGFQKIFEALFQIVRTERANYVRADSSRKESSAESRLSNAAAAVRLVAELGSSRIKYKTATGVLDHIVDTVPLANKASCPPIRNDYLKTFRAILLYPSHGEHLKVKQWQELVDFVTQSIEHASTEDQSNSNATSMNGPDKSSRNGSLVSLRASQVSSSRTRMEDSTYIEELCFCLRQLASITNAPLLSRSEVIADCLLGFLSYATRSQDAAFETLNIVLQRALTEDVGLARKMTIESIATVRRNWSIKSVALREQMLIFLMLGKGFLSEPHIGESTASDRSLPDLLYGTMWLELGGRAERDILQIDDIQFPEPEDTPPLRLRTICPLSDSTRATTNWVTLSILASLLCSTHRKQTLQQVAEKSTTSPFKRRKALNAVDEALSDAITSTGTERLCAIQLLLFVLEESENPEGTIVERLPELASGITDDDTSVSSWTLVLLSRLAFTKVARDSRFQADWLQAWHWATRSLTNHSTSRAACHFVDSILRSGTLKNVIDARMIEDCLFPNGMNGPPVLSDSALQMWNTILSSHFLVQSGAHQNMVSKIMSWLSATWILPRVLDRLHNAQIANFTKSTHVYRLLRSCMGDSITLRPAQQGIVTNCIWRAALCAAQSARLARYLLDGHIEEPATDTGSRPEPFVSLDAASQSRLQHTILEVLTTKLKNFRDSWHSLLQERTSNINTDIVQALAFLCSIAHVFGSTSSGSRSQLREDLLLLTDQVWEMLCQFIAQLEADTRTRSLVLVSEFLLRFSSQNVQHDALLNRARRPLISSVLHLMRQDLDSQTDQSVVYDGLMDLDDTPVSQSSQSHADSNVGLGLRQDLPFSGNLVTGAVHMTMRMLIEHTTSDGYANVDSSTTSTIIDFALALSSSNLMAARLPLMTFLQAGPNVSRADACRLLESLAEMCLQDVDLERCETALCLCLEAMTSLLLLWTVESEEDDLFSVAFDMYSWYCEVALAKNIATPRVLILMASLLDGLLEIHPSFGSEESLPSPRTSLFQILQTGDNRVKFQLTSQISRIFDRFILSEHDAIFSDVLECLPSDPVDLGGIAVRLYVLAELAYKWHTVLRRAVYHLFETAAHVPTSMAFAQSCIRILSRRLHIDHPRQLFRLFSPQIIYTWLEKEKLDSMPYQVFDYPSRKELLLDIQDEVVGQIAMRVSEQHAHSVASIVQVSWVDLLSTSFAQAEAYAVARDISIPKEDEQRQSAESWVRKQLGQDEYAARLRAELPNILTTLFLSLNDEGIDRAFLKHKASSATTIWSEVCGLAQSKMALPVGQQPVFRAKYLLDEMVFFCHRIDTDLQTLWSPPLLVHIARALFNSADPALGPLNASSVLRKVRILVCLVGDVATQGYPLEMLLTSLTPYLTQFHCSEDALGLFWYLLDHGKSELQARLPFIAGLSISVFASLSKFLTSPQDSTTQEMHFLATMSKGQAFRDWFSKYLESFNPVDDDSASIAVFQKLTTCACSITGPGRNSRGTSEGALIFSLLEDQASEQPLLNRSSFVQAIATLCHEFEFDQVGEDDMASTDVDAVRFSKVVRELLQHRDLPDAFHVWAAQLLGRAHAAESQLRSSPSQTRSNKIVAPVEDSLYQSFSYGSILTTLATSMRVAKGHVKGIAEQTLQNIITALPPQIRSTGLGSFTDKMLLEDLHWKLFPAPPLSVSPSLATRLQASPYWRTGESKAKWASDLAISLCAIASTDSVLASLPAVLAADPELATDMLSEIVHIVLLSDRAGQQAVRQMVSAVFQQSFTDHDESSRSHLESLFNVLLFLRQQPLPREATMADRNNWLDIGYLDAASAAFGCGMYRTALLFLEIHASQQHLLRSRSSRRSSVPKTDEQIALAHKIYQNVDDPDFFFSVKEQPNMDSVMRHLSHEDSGYKSLSFQSALYDCNSKSTNGQQDSAMFQALSAANMNGLARATQIQSKASDEDLHPGNTLKVALNLHDWDLPSRVRPNEQIDPAVNLFRILDNFSNKETVTKCIDTGLLATAKHLASSTRSVRAEQILLSTLAVLSEAREVLTVKSFDQLDEARQKLEARSLGQDEEGFEKTSIILLSREALFAAIRQKGPLREMLKVSIPESQLLEIQAVRHSLRIARKQEAAQFCLNHVMYLTSLADNATSTGLNVHAAVHHDLAQTLWTQGQASASIQILRQVIEDKDIAQQAISVNRAEILADLGHQVSDSRLEKPDEVISRYLLPAMKELHGNSEGEEAGRVFHNFAVFCDEQLKNADDREEFERVENVRRSKEEEMRDLHKHIRALEGKPSEAKRREQFKGLLSKARQWFKLDDEDYRRMKSAREKFVQQSLENYLLSMRACDRYNSDVLRFVALWLEHSDSPSANAAVGKSLSKVPSHKFAPLMNQLSSKILDREDDFQPLLRNLIFRICLEHPHHSLYQMFSASKTRGAKTDEIALSRYNAAVKLTNLFPKYRALNDMWFATHNCCIAVARLANHQLPEKAVKPGSKLRLRDIDAGRHLDQGLRDASTKVPPPTMHIPLRPDGDYSSVPTFASFEPYLSIAGGVSAPKIVTMLSTAGKRYKMLLKGGNDDLRQDSIMEQVFAQVSHLLTSHRATRQRRLGIRTYKVLPLTTNAGIIEFVQNTTPLHEYLLPAHTRYFPRDYKPSRCRKEIADAQSKPLSQRIQAYRNVTSNFHPVMRFFFTEHFPLPHDWFAKRLAYARSTAAISILGHVLGLGDRHGHNILLDSTTGEVVHIDLGVAFEAGRVLPVPEVVPFRLTRDLVDGMGLSGVEGVFRRCCTFTLEALRKEQESIMVILDVLRYDPLYSWSISPLRLARMQEAQDADAALTETPDETATPDAAAAAAPSVKTDDAKKKKKTNEPSEAERALTTVQRKLGKGLSVEATVNELIQQATDERNLACLYCGWAAYA